jgi:hypothetical protein
MTLVEVFFVFFFLPGLLVKFNSIYCWLYRPFSIANSHLSLVLGIVQVITAKSWSKAGDSTQSSSHLIPWWLQTMQELVARGQHRHIQKVFLTALTPHCKTSYRTRWDISVVESMMVLKEGSPSSSTCPNKQLSGTRRPRCTEHET